MNISKSDIEKRFQDMTDEAIVQRYLSGTLTDVAQEIAKNELVSRGISIPSSKDVSSDPLPEGERGDLVRVSGFLTYAEGVILCSVLESEGIPSVMADAHMATANQVLSTVTGGIRLLVHENNLDVANEVIAAFKRGDYQIDEDFDVGAQ